VFVTSAIGNVGGENCAAIAGVGENAMDARLPFVVLSHAATATAATTMVIIFMSNLATLGVE
jgi:hypothetical protein